MLSPDDNKPMPNVHSKLQQKSGELQQQQQQQQHQQQDPNRIIIRLSAVDIYQAIPAQIRLYARIPCTTTFCYLEFQ
jgi:hypothetical protein